MFRVGLAVLFVAVVLSMLGTLVDGRYVRVVDGEIDSGQQAVDPGPTGQRKPTSWLSSHVTSRSSVRSASSTMVGQPGWPAKVRRQYLSPFWNAMHLRSEGVRANPAK